jgi:hypothetical protein
MKTQDAAKVRRLEAELTAERERRRKAEASVGGLRSLTERLKTALAVSRAEAAKLKGAQPHAE